ncbi:MAG: class I SAM-dependent methyltransferase [Sedimentisphaerales bacterium]|nr:class I SAM-dependent methyltransferase [Sedimentisphaerales bacterium]
MTIPCARPSEIKHHHRGKSSAEFLDASLILNHLSIQPGQTIVDAGCGDGHMAKAFAAQLRNTGMVYALDVDGEMIAKSQKNAQESNVTFLQADITQKTSLAPVSVDLLYLSMVIHGFSKSQINGLQNEVKRLLKPGGVLAIVEIAKKETPFGPPLNIRFSAEELQRTLAFIPIATINIGSYFYLQMFHQSSKTENNG